MGNKFARCPNIFSYPKQTQRIRLCAEEEANSQATESNHSCCQT